MEKLKIAQIGINLYSHARQIFGSLKKQTDIFEIAGYCLVEDEREKFKGILNTFDGYRELTLDEILNDESITAVTVETEEKHLTKYALMAVTHGKHVHMEKPGGADLKEFEELIAAVKQAGTVFHTGYMYRYNPIVKEELANIKNGVYGEIESVEAQMSVKEELPVRQWLGDYKGGMMFFLGCHLVDLVLQIKGEPKAIHLFNRTTGRDGVNAEDYGMAVFDYGNGTSFIKTSAVEHIGFARRQLVVTGTKGSFEIKPLEKNVSGGMLETVIGKGFADGKSDFGKSYVYKTSEPYDRYDTMLSSFAEYVLKGKKNPYTPDYELTLYKTLLKCCGII